ncbi:hypothetical protein CRE_30998 [Caenorhabditis remanei]|uniref:Uncharacterized protein n=1 Tax=Caenorhabditis remanei TaxID=31234 RepID=E3LU02_CAERE|nr:hypothetical protein CRE_30998 [Caenorhabditis remanei]
MREEAEEGGWAGRRDTEGQTYELEQWDAGDFGK